MLNGFCETTDPPIRRDHPDAPNDLGIHTIQNFIHEDANRSVGVFGDLTLHTALQPIFSLSHKRIIGYEALARVQNAAKQFIHPENLFRHDQNESSTVFLDRLCRYVHINNFKLLNDQINWLFLNVSPQTVINGKKYGSFFDDLLSATQFPAHRIVIEIVEHPISDTDLLNETVAYYKSGGCLIAIDDFGKGGSNFERIWSLNPEIVKLDRSMIVRACRQESVRQLLPGIVSLLHQAGSLVLIEGIETEDQAMIALESDADFVQGFFFSRPSTDLQIASFQSSATGLIFEKYKENSMHEENKTNEIYRRFHRLFLDAMEHIRCGHLLEPACGCLLSNPRVIRCYLLMPNGIQIGQTVVSGHFTYQADIRFRPLEDAKSADWFRRHYLRRAVVHPDQLQITRPYLSITGAHMCITLSMMFSTQAGDRVFCCDLLTE